MSQLIEFIVHIVRLFLAKTIHRNAEHELDEVTPLSVGALPPDISNDSDGRDFAVSHEESPPLLPIEEEKAEVHYSSRLPPIIIGPDGWLSGDKIIRIPSERCYGWRSKSGKPLGALWHWTSTPHGTGLAMARRIVKAPGTSVHLWIEHDGTIYQSAPMTRSTGHAGGSTARRVREENGNVVFDDQSRLDVNSFLLGIELVCIGEVRLVKKLIDGSYGKAVPGESGAVFMGWPFGRWSVSKDDKGNNIIGPDGKPVLFVDKGPTVGIDQVVEEKDQNGIKRCYQEYTDEQIDAAERLIRAWKDKYGWTDAQMSWGHIDSDPTRKEDPGPLWKKRCLPEIFKRINGK